MDGSFVITWKEILIGAVIVLAIYIAEVVLLLRSGRGMRSWLGRSSEAREIERLAARVAALEQRLTTPTQSMVPDAEAAEAEGAATPYARAFALAKEGVDVAQVAARCGISRAEAELIVAMQRKAPH